MNSLGAIETWRRDLCRPALTAWGFENVSRRLHTICEKNKLHVTFHSKIMKSVLWLFHRSRYIHSVYFPIICYNFLVICTTFYRPVPTDVGSSLNNLAIHPCAEIQLWSHPVSRPYKLNIPSRRSVTWGWSF